MPDGGLYRVGERVVYYQPGIGGILAHWSGGRPVRDGELRTVTITAVHPEGFEWYYDTAEGVFLKESDIEGRAT